MKRLSREEQERASRLVFAADRYVYVMAHTLMHYALATAAGIRNCRFRRSEYGKPEVVSPAGEAPPSFNLSHTQGLAVCAVGFQVDLGIDAEIVRPEVDAMGLAKAVFSEAEIADLGGLRPSERIDAFYRRWTLKEAITKAVGKGLQMPTRDFTVTLDPPSVSFAATSTESDANWLLAERPTAAGHKTALAIRRPTSAPNRVAWHDVRLDTVSAFFLDPR